MEPLSFPEAAKKLAKYGIRKEQIYLIDLVLLAEMAWADGKIQMAEQELLYSYLNHHVNSINRLAGCQIIGYNEAREFVKNLLEERPSRELVAVIEEVVPLIRLNNKEPQVAEQIRIDILNACLDIASSAVTKYPYGMTERFTQEEKDYYHKITDILRGYSRQ